MCACVCYLRAIYERVSLLNASFLCLLASISDVRGAQSRSSTPESNEQHDRTRRCLMHKTKACARRPEIALLHSSYSQLKILRHFSLSRRVQTPTTTTTTYPRNRSSRSHIRKCARLARLSPSSQGLADLVRHSISKRRHAHVVPSAHSPLALGCRSDLDDMSARTSQRVSWMTRLPLPCFCSRRCRCCCRGHNTRWTLRQLESRNTCSLDCLQIVLSVLTTQYSIPF